MITVLASIGTAFGFGGSFAGPEGGAVPTSSATQLVVAHAATGNTVTLTAQVATSLTDLALILPVPGIRPETVVPLIPGQFARIEAFTQPRVERLTCDELVDIFHWESPPGCASFDPQRGVDLIGEDAVDAVSALPAPFATVDLELEVITPDQLAAWLDVRGLALDPGYAAALQPHLDAKEPLLTVRPTFPLALGEWLPPVRFIMNPGDWALPLTIGDAAGIGQHELYVYTLSGDADGDPALANYPDGLVQSECVLAAGQDVSEWIAAERAAIAEEITVPAWVLEYAGLADRCSPCTADPLIDFEVAALGSPLPANETRLGRIRFAWDAGALFEDPVLSFAQPATDHDLRFLLHEPGLDAIYQPCGATAPDPNAPVCDNVRLSDASGCDSSPRLAPLLAVGLAAALLVRRRPALLGALLALTVARSASAAPPDASPRTELSATVSVIGTDRIVPTGLDRGAPWLLNPYLGLEVRRSLFAWSDGRSVGLMGALRGLVGKAAPWGDRGVLSFALLEPTVALDVRHGRLREATPCWFGRYGADLSLPIVDPSASTPQARLVGGLHAGVGVWLGRGPQRTALELRGTVFPRTDGFETTYDPNLGLPGYMFLPGTANLWVVAGRAFY